MISAELSFNVYITCHILDNFFFDKLYVMTSFFISNLLTEEQGSKPPSLLVKNDQY